jgi:hypothetical protein
MNPDLVKILLYIGGSNELVSDLELADAARTIVYSEKITEIHLCGVNSPSFEEIHTSVF